MSWNFKKNSPHLEEIQIGNINPGDIVFFFVYGEMRVRLILSRKENGEFVYFLLKEDFSRFKSNEIATSKLSKTETYFKLKS